MRKKKLTQKTLGEAIGVAQSAISGWLNGAFPGSAELYRLSRALGVEMQWFFDSFPHEGTAGEQIKTMSVLKVPVNHFTLDEIKRLGKSIHFLESGQTNKLTDAETYENLSSVKRTWENLLVEINQATKESGKVSELAKFLSERTGRKVPLASVSRWLAGSREPGAKITMLMLQWVEREQVK